MLNENMVAITKRELDDAIQNHIAAMYPDKAGICTSWFCSVERIDEDDTANLYLATSTNLAGWNLVGMAWVTCKQVFAALSQP